MKNNKIKILLGSTALVLVFLWLLFKAEPEDTIQPPDVDMAKVAEVAKVMLEQPPSAPEKPVKTAVSSTKEPTKVKGVSVYKVVPSFPNQHFFDDKLCNLYQVRQNLQPMLTEAIERLDSRYQHSSHELSEYLVLNLYTQKESEYFLAQLSERIKALHIYYIKLMGQSAKQPITLNIVLAPRRSEYLKQVTYYHDSLVNSLGVYFGGLNLAYVDYQKSDKKALRTAVHESVHIMNAHILGKTPHMFNEGMAELFEDMFINEGLIEIDHTAKKVSRKSYPIMEFFDNNQWPFLDTHQLYYSSWLWYSYMSSDPERQKALTHFMRQERKDPCRSFNADESYSIFQDAHSMFEYEFTEWQDVLPDY